MLQVEILKFAYDSSEPILRNIHFNAVPGEITGIIGPNGSGKSTLMKCIAGLLKPEGTIRLSKNNTSPANKKRLGQWVSYLPQENSFRAVLTVFETVLLGRMQSLSWRVGKEDLTAVLKMLETLRIEMLASRFLGELSGGQRQMVWMAQALVRQPMVLLLDEPLNSLDLRYALEILDMVKEITALKKIITVIVLHDLNLVGKYADKIILLRDGDVYSSGTPKTVLTMETIRSVYGVNCKVANNDGVLQITPLCSIRPKFERTVR